MTRTLLTAIFLTLLSQTAWADEMFDKGDYTARINDTLDKNGADCRVDTYSVEEKTSTAIIFSVKCTHASYLKEIEVTCTQTPSEQCFVSRY
ncbi:hypothetical protein N8Z70_02455 [Candidatus Puniceispirillum sp.]|nr:hypothetical protein [Alphaproteobacteria bacterium]MDC1293889.1 hypothetical protein [Candidatus Puniceispirillum sp.]